MSKHRVVLTFDDGVTAKLICPESGCVPAEFCAGCGRSYGDGEREPCFDCRAAPDECWVKGWFDEVCGLESLYGSVTVEIYPEWDYDYLKAHIVEAKKT